MVVMVKHSKSARRGAAAVLLAACLTATAQGPGSSSPGSAGVPPAGGISSSDQNLGLVVGATQQLGAPGPATSPQNSTTGTQDPSFRGSVVRDKATDGVVQLTLDDALQRGLRNNLGLILQNSSVMSANGRRVQQVDLAAYGLKFPGINPIIGPFQTVDFRAYLSQNLVNLQALETYIAAKHNFEASKLTAQDARDLVVLTVGNAYLLCIADAARITAVKAEMAEAKVSLDQATAAHDAGTSPRLDVLRAQVDYQNEEQQLIAASNQLDKDKIALARAIGLPMEQKFELSEDVPFAALNTPDPDAAFQQALKQRKDLAAAAETLKGAEANRKSAFYEQMPVADVAANYGDLGQTPGHSHGTYTATGEITAPILQLAKTHGDEQVAQAQVDQAKAKLSDQTQQVNADVRDAILDIQTAAKLVEAARSNVDLAHEALSEAQQRFKAGVADTLPVSQALATEEQANDQYISALYQHNIAKLDLARALGVAASSSKTYLGGK
jgi:outer membrane protein TolC